MTRDPGVVPMSRSRLFFFFASLTLVLPILAGTLLFAADRSKSAPEDDSFYKYLSVFSEVLSLVRQSHVDEPDTASLMAGVLEGTTDSLDAFSFYVPPTHVEAYLAAEATGRSRSGIYLLKEHGIAYVVSVDPGSPGATAGVSAGDLVAQVNGASTRNMPLWQMRNVLAGPAGSEVGLEVMRLGAPVKLTVKLQPFTKAEPALSEVDGASVLRIPTFEAGTSDQVRKLLAEAGTRDRLLIDLRHVSTGEPEAAFATAELFTSGELGSLVRRGESLQSWKSEREPLWRGRKVVLLVNRTTLGAAEVFTAVLRQKLKAELVGDRTFGHAGRQGVAELSNGGRLFFTEAFYTGPDAKPINESLQPDLQVDRSRTFVERNVPIDELILKRGVDRLLDRHQQQAETEKKAA